MKHFKIKSLPANWLNCKWTKLKEDIHSEGGILGSVQYSVEAQQDARLEMHWSGYNLPEHCMGKAWISDELKAS